MANTLKFRGGSTSDITSSTVSDREIVFDTDKNTLVLGSAKDYLMRYGGNSQSGNVGIGVANPSTALDVSGTVAATSYTESVATAQTALDPANGGIQTFVTSGSTTFTDSLATGESMTLMIRRASASHTVTFPTTKWAGGVTPPVTTTSGKYSIVSLWKVGSDLYGSYGGDA